MDIKQVIKKQKIRHRLLLLFSWIPDRIMLPIQYYLILHRWPNLRNPKRFTEKIQCYKMSYRNPLMLECVDKFKVREYVIRKLGSAQYLNKLYQVCDDAQDIDFVNLPNSFVIKTTDGGNGDNVLVCRDKTILDLEKTVRVVNGWRNKKYYWVSREWAYRGAIPSRIIVEKFLESPENADGSIDDYKFLCFGGKFRYLWVDKNRYSNHKRGWWNENLEFIPKIDSDYPSAEEAFHLPENIREMISIAEKLSEDFPFVRVDLYNIRGKIIFGELTFYPFCGYAQFSPDSFDFELGEHFNL